jgi:SAM-dependent methyltransferase
MGRKKGSTNKPKVIAIKSVTKPVETTVQGTEYWKNRPLEDTERDWKYEEKDWVQDYWRSKVHPHRTLLLEAMVNLFPFKSILEIGCNCGPNLALFKDYFFEARLAGLDINEQVIEKAENLLRGRVELKVGSFMELPWPDDSFDVVVSDAVLLYASPSEITQALNEINRVAKKAIVLVERYSPSLAGEVVGHVWGRDYGTLLKGYGFKVKEKSIGKKHWRTSLNWQKYGKLIIAER